VLINSTVDQEYLAHYCVQICYSVVCKLVSDGREVDSRLEPIYFIWKALPLALNDLKRYICYCWQLL
jgi:hypothetical protein